MTNWICFCVVLLITYLNASARPASNDVNLILVYPEPNSKYFIEHTENFKFFPKTTKRPITRKNSLYVSNKDGKTKFTPATVDKIIENNAGPLLVKSGSDALVPLFGDNTSSSFLSKNKENGVGEDLTSRGNTFSQKTAIKALEEQPLKLTEDTVISEPLDSLVFESLKPDVETKVLINKDEPQLTELKTALENQKIPETFDNGQENISQDVPIEKTLIEKPYLVNEPPVSEPQKEYIEYDSKISAVLLDLYNDTVQNTEPEKLTTFIEQTIGSVMAEQLEKGAPEESNSRLEPFKPSTQKTNEETTKVSTKTFEMETSTEPKSTSAVQTDMELMGAVNENVNTEEMMTTTDNGSDVISTIVDFDRETTPIPSTE